GADRVPQGPPHPLTIAPPGVNVTPLSRPIAAGRPHVFDSIPFERPTMTDSSMRTPTNHERWNHATWTLCALCAAIGLWLVLPDRLLSAQPAARRANRMIEM